MFVTMTSLYVELSVNAEGYVNVDIFMKYRDAYCQHNWYLNLKTNPIHEQIRLIKLGKCPKCTCKMVFSYHDKNNLLECNKCNFEAWSDKFYDDINIDLLSGY